MQDRNHYVIQVGQDQSYHVIKTTCVEDKELSWKAKGIHTYFSTRPSGWTIWWSELLVRSEDGHFSLRSGLKELQDKGYVYRIVRRGKFKGTIQWGFATSPVPVTKDQMSELLTDGWKICGKSELPTDSSEKTTSRKPHNGFHEMVSTPLNSNNTITDSTSVLSLENSSSSEEHASPETDSHNNISQILKRDKRQKIKDRQSLFKQKTHTFTISAQNQHIIDYWNSLGLQKMNPNTKALKTACEKLDALRKGSLFPKDVYPEYYGKKFIIKDIKAAIANFATAAFDRDYMPLDKSKIAKLYLGDFLYNPFFINGDRSKFIRNLMPPDPVETLIRDENRSITNMFIRFYCDKVVKTMYEEDLTIKDRNAFIRGTKLFLNWYEDSEHLIYGDLHYVIELYMRFILKCKQEEKPERGFSISTPGQMLSEYMITKTFPSFLESRAMLKGSLDDSIPDYYDSKDDVEDARDIV